MRPSARAINLYKTRLFDRISLQDAAIASELRQMKLPWYHMRNQSSADTEDSTAEIFIYDEIGGSFGIDAAQFVEDLQAIDADNIDVRINSPGGDVFDSIAIYNALVKHPANITVYVDALAASGASIIAMAGDKVVMMVGSQLMIHDALAPTLGNAAEHEEMAEWLHKQSDNLSTIYAARGGGEAKDWRAMMVAETWMFAAEAVDLKLADEVYAPAPKKFKPGEEDMPPDGGESDDDPPEDDDEEIVADAVTEEAALNALMHRQHRLTNRGFKFLGRRAAPTPPTDAFAQYRNKFLKRSDNRGGLTWLR